MLKEEIKTRSACLVVDAVTTRSPSGSIHKDWPTKVWVGGWVVGWVFGWLVGWMVGWFICCLTPQQQCISGTDLLKQLHVLPH